MHSQKRATKVGQGPFAQISGFKSQVCYSLALRLPPSWSDSPNLYLFIFKMAVVIAICLIEVRWKYSISVKCKGRYSDWNDRGRCRDHPTAVGAALCRLYLLVPVLLPPSLTLLSSPPGSTGFSTRRTRRAARAAWLGKETKGVSDWPTHLTWPTEAAPGEAKAGFRPWLVGAVRPFVSGF